MPATLQTITTKHQDALAEIANRVELIDSAVARFAVEDAISDASDAFAEVITHFEEEAIRRSAAVGIALDIERATR